ncbi:MAG: hypothetical protein JSU66_08090, partial [Deltaproteobacteria bacterium]
MKISVEATQPTRVAADLLAVPMAALDADRPRLPARLGALDRALGGRIATILQSGDFRGKRGDVTVFHPDPGASAKRVMLVGLGPENEVDAEALRRASAALVSTATARGARRVALLAPPSRRLAPPDVAQALAEGAVLAGFRFDRYVSKREEPSEPPSAVALVFAKASDLRTARIGCGRGNVLAESQNVARRLSNEPPNALPPAALAREAQRVAREVGLGFRALAVPELKRRKMGGILAVGQGSTNPPRLIVIEHNHGPRAGRKRGARPATRRPTVCLVGKGI